MITIASQAFDPLAKGAFMLFSPWVCTPVGTRNPPGKLLGDDLMRVVAQHDVDFVCDGIKRIQKPLRVERAAGTGDGD